MAYYEELEKIQNSVIATLLENQDICKLLYYYPEEVNLRYDPLAQPDIDNPNQLLLTQVFPVPKTPDVELDQTCLLAVWLKGGDTMFDNKGYRKVIVVIDIICHLDCWIIKNGFRPMRLLNKIDETFNYKNFKGINVINKIESLPFRAKEYSTKFYGYQISYEFQLPSWIGCNNNGVQ